MMGVFLQPFVSHFGKTKLPLHDTEGVFDPGANSGFRPVLCSVFIGQFAIPAAFSVREIPGSRRVIGNDISFPGIGRITPYPGFLSVQQITENNRIVNIGGCSYHGMNQPGFAIYTDMRLHPEIPLIPFLRLVHIRIALSFLVLGGTGRINDRCIDNGAAGNFYPVLIEIFINQMEQVIAEIVLFHQMAKLTDRGFVGNRLLTEIDTDEDAHGAGIIQGFFGSGIGQVEPVLEEMNSQHALNTDGTATGSFGVWIVGGDGFAELFPGDNGFHVIEKALFPRLFAEFLEAICQRVLLHREYHSGDNGDSCIIARIVNKSEMP